MSIGQPTIFSQSTMRRRGIALILVLLVMAVASILAFALLSAGALAASYAGQHAASAN